MPSSQVLVEYGADVDATDHRLRTALAMAAAAGYSHVVTRLAEKGGNVSAHDAEGFTPLHWAASMGHVRALIPTLSPQLIPQPFEPSALLAQTPSSEAAPHSGKIRLGVVSQFPTDVANRTSASAYGSALDESSSDRPPTHLRGPACIAWVSSTGTSVLIPSNRSVCVYLYQPSKLGASSGRRGARVSRRASALLGCWAPPGNSPAVAPAAAPLTTTLPPHQATSPRGGFSGGNSWRRCRRWCGWARHWTRWTTDARRRCTARRARAT